MFCLPKSQQWRAVVEGALWMLTRGRTWDEDTGSITEAQALAWEIVDGLDMTCLEDFIKTQRMIAAAVAGEYVDLTSPLPDFVDYTQNGLSVQLSLANDEIRRLNAIIAGEQIMGEDELGDPIVEHDYTENGLTPVLDKALHIDRDVYPDLNISQVLMKGLVGRTIGFPWPFVGEGIADILEERINELDGRFRQFDLTIPGGLEKNITETLESLLRDQGQSIFDPEWRPNIANIMQRSFNVADDSPMAEGLAKLINEWAWKLGIPGGIHDDSPRSVAEIMLVISQMMKDGNIATGNLELSTIINILNAQQCGTCGEVNGNCTCPGTSITVEDDQTPQIEGSTDNLLECGCEDAG